MSVTLSIALYSPNPGCPPTRCYQAGSAVAFELTSSSVNKSADGSGWLIGALTGDAQPQNQVGAGNWVYTINFPDTELSAELLGGEIDPLEAKDMNSGDGAVGLCCLDCGTLMILDKLLSLEIRKLNRESFRLFNHDQAITASLKRLFRNHSTIEIHAIEASMEEHLTGYPYADDPGNVTLKFTATPAQQTGPHAQVTPTELVIDPASAEPLTGIVRFVPPLEITGGRGFGVTIDSFDPEAHLGLEIHIDYRILSS